MIKYRRLLIVSFLGLSVAAAVFAVARFVPHGNLIERSKLIPLPRNRLILWWENSREIRLLRTDHQDDLVDIHSGRIRTAQSPADFIERARFRHNFLVTSSPDGRWLLGCDRASLGPNYCEVRNMDGTLKLRTIRWESSEMLPGRHETSCRWFRNSIGYGVVSCRNGRWTYAEYKLADRLPYRKTDIDHLVSMGSRDADLSLMGFTNSGEPVIMRKSWGPWYSRYAKDFIVLDRFAHSTWRTVAFEPPSGAELSEDVIRSAKVSPKGDRIAWRLAGAFGHQLLPNWLCRLLRINPPKSQREVGIWLSDIDGTHWRCVGTVPTTVSQPEDRLGWPISWSPDGNKIMFWHNDHLYFLSV